MLVEVYNSDSSQITEYSPPPTEPAPKQSRRSRGGGRSRRAAKQRARASKVAKNGDGDPGGTLTDMYSCSESLEFYKSEYNKHRHSLDYTVYYYHDVGYYSWRGQES